MLNLLANANTLVPYLAIRQTLKIGNVATMSKYSRSRTCPEDV